ncbi:MAG: MCE family protein [Haloechinothrix sp.]
MTASRQRITRIGTLAVIVALVATAATLLVVRAPDSNRVTAYFTGTVGLYPESDVRVLGVSIGTVDAVEPLGTRVKVTMSLDPDVEVPADANAVIVTPSLVSDRYVQLAPVYTGGSRLADRAVIPVERTAVPAEIDELFSSLDSLTTALGPDGANGDGALSDLLHSAATNLDGNGKHIGTMIRELGKAARTLSGSEEDLFGTVEKIQQFTTMLADNDDEVREFDRLLAEVAEIFANEREDFAVAMHELSGALGKVDAFVRANRGKIKSNVDKLTGTTKVLAQRQESLAEALDEAPSALANLLMAYDPATGTLDGRANLNEFSMGADESSSAPPLPLPPSEGGR